LPGRLTNLEIYGDYPEALANFYRELLGWGIEKAEGVDYWRMVRRSRSQVAASHYGRRSRIPAG
jgi:predicted enzyme related to lactoylglutathione lyase